MKNKFGARFFALLLCAAALCSLCALPALADDVWSNPQPQLTITRKDMDPIKPGEEFTLTVSMSFNNSYVSVQSPRVTFEPSEAFMIVDATPTKTIPDFRRNDLATASIKLKALGEIKSPIQDVKVTVNFSYDGGSAGLTNGSSSETIYIPVESSGTVLSGAPVPVITRDEVGTVSAGSEFTMNIHVENVGKSDMVQPMLSISTSAGLNLMDAAKSRLLSDVPAGASIDVPVKLKADSRISSPSLSLDLELKYNYAGGTGTTSQSLYIPATVNSNSTDDPSYTELATPNVIIRQYSYGEGVTQIAAGATFDLVVEFENTSSIFTVENIVMTVTPGEGLSIASGSNTVHYASLRAGASQSETFSILALPTAKTGAAKLDIGFSYEYVENRTRKHVNPSQSISIPIYQPDRFEVELPTMPTDVNAYEEMYISLPYVNKGKSEVSNIRAELVSEDGAVSALTPVQNLGNFAAGASGTIDFIFTPQMPGEIDFTFLITYEDPNAKEKTLEFPIHMNVMEPYYPSFDDPGMIDPGMEDPSMNEKSGLPWWAWTLIGLAVVGAAVVVIVLVKKKKKKTAGELSDFVWEAPEATDAAEAEADTETVGGSK